jgi:hypothetical protein
MLSIAELTADEHERFDELKRELLDLRDAAARRGEAVSAGAPQSMWHFPDGARITLVCHRLPEERRPPSADPRIRDYVRWAELADLDTLIDVYGAIRAYNPTSRVRIMAAQDLQGRDISTHLILIGGQTWGVVAPQLSRIFPIPVDIGDPFHRLAIAVRDSTGTEHEFKYTLGDDEMLVEDVGVFARGENPSAPHLTLTICSGITTRGVHGAARCFIDPGMRERNEQYLLPRFPGASAYCIVMKVPVVNLDPLTPDLSKPENRLFEWSDLGAEANN